MFDRLRSKFGRRKSRRSEEAWSEEVEWNGGSLGARDGEVNDINDDFEQTTEPDGKSAMGPPRAHCGC